MRNAMRVGLLTALVALGTAGAVAAQPQLAIQGESYFDGGMTLSVTNEASVGELVWLGVGLDPLPLDAPVQTGKGPWYIGLLTHSLVLGPVPPTGQLDLPFTMPSEVLPLVGIPIVVQLLADGALSNPATIHLDQPYFQAADAKILVSPNPTVQANFGDRVAVGDFNDDGDRDIAVGAWFEDYLGIDKAGRAYVLWGPDFASSTTLSPASPKVVGVFGLSMTVDDLNGDAVDDLIIGETTGDPPAPGVLANLHVYLGNATFPTSPSLDIPSAGDGPVYTLFGRNVATGDYNDDTFTDVAVGVKEATVAGLTQAGRIDVYLGPDFLTRLEVISPDPESNDRFGTRVATADVNGDGIDDLVESSCGDDVGGVTNIGSAHLFTGPSLNLFKSIPNPEPAGSLTCFGYLVHMDDLNGDMRSEIIVSDSRNRVFVFWSPSYDTYLVVPKPALPGQLLVGETSYGYSLGSADINNDGMVDLLIGDPFEGELTGCPISNGGTLFGALGPYFSTFYRITDAQADCGSFFAWSLVVADIDRDGRPELIVGDDIGDDGGVFNSGHVSVFDCSQQASD